jgi:hypothetical protein
LYAVQHIHLHTKYWPPDSLLQPQNLEQEIISELLRLAEREAVSPKVFHVWLYISGSPAALTAGLKQSFSVDIRSKSISRFVKVLQSKHWIEAWNGIRGAQGLLSLLAQFSAAHVHQFFSKMDRIMKGPVIDERGTNITAVLQGLLHSLFPESPIKTTDVRYFANSGCSLYAKLLPMCDSQFARMVIEDESKTSIHNKNFIEWMFRPPQFNLLPPSWQLLMEWRKRDALTAFQNLILAFSMTQRHLPGFSQSMQFKLHLIRELVAHEDTKAPEQISIMEIIMPLATKAWRRRHQIAGQHFEDIFVYCCKYLHSHPIRMELGNLVREGFLHYLVRAWAETSQGLPLQESLVLVIQEIHYCNDFDLASQEKGWYYAGIFVPWVELSKRYNLLRLFSMNFRKKNIELDRDDDLMAVEKFHLKILRLIEPDMGLKVLRRIRGSDGTLTSCFHPILESC